MANILRLLFQRGNVSGFHFACIPVSIARVPVAIIA
jgi:hypothetical protein